MSELICLLDGRKVGTVRQTGGRLSFSYARSWRGARGAYPLSLSMPLAQETHPHSAIERFMWGLLPDNEFVLQRWGSKFQVSPRNVFGLIANVGEDCAGAVQFLTPARFEQLQSADDIAIDWLTESEVAQRLRILRTDAAAGRAPGDAGQFSLAGAQPKTALLFDGQRWGVPSGRTPTTHILKPTTAEFDGHAENEHLCLSLARALGLPTATTAVRAFEDVTAIVVTRYDRVHTAPLAEEAAAAPAARSRPPEAARKGTTILRVHQEDLCQALSIHPSRKYQNEGGPGPRDIIDLFRASIGGSGDALQTDIAAFVDALVFNWLIGGTDAHAKNYSILFGANGMARLAPLYDVASIFAYPQIDFRKSKLAMKIGGEYRIERISWPQWRKFAKETSLNAEEVVARALAMAHALPQALAEELARARDTGLAHPSMELLAAALTKRARSLAEAGAWPEP